MVPTIKVDPLIEGWAVEMASDPSIMYRLITSHNNANSNWYRAITDINCIMHDCNMHLNTDYYLQTVPSVGMPTVKILEIYVIDSIHMFQLMLVDDARLQTHFNVIQERI